MKFILPYGGNYEVAGLSLGRKSWVRWQISSREVQAVRTVLRAHPNHASYGIGHLVIELKTKRFSFFHELSLFVASSIKSQENNPGFSTSSEVLLPFAWTKAKKSFMIETALQKH